MPVDKRMISLEPKKLFRLQCRLELLLFFHWWAYRLVILIMIVYGYRWILKFFSFTCVLLVCQNQRLFLVIFLLAHRQLRDFQTSPSTAAPGHLYFSFHLNAGTLVASIFQDLIRSGFWNRLLVVGYFRINFLLLNLTWATWRSGLLKE